MANHPIIPMPENWVLMTWLLKVFDGHRELYFSLELKHLELIRSNQAHSFLHCLNSFNGRKKPNITNVEDYVSV